MLKYRSTPLFSRKFLQYLLCTLYFLYSQVSIRILLSLPILLLSQLGTKYDIIHKIFDK